MMELKDEGYYIEPVPYARTLAVCLYGSTSGFPLAPALNDQDIRLAMSLALDREAISEALWPGIWHPPIAWVYANQPFTFGVDYDFWKAYDGYQYDLDRAKALMAESDYPEGFELELYISQDRPPGLAYRNVEAGELIAEMWADIGITVTLLPTTHDIMRPWWFADPPEPRIQGVAMMWGGSSTPVNTGRPYQYFHSQGTHKLSNNPDIDAAIEGLELISNREVLEPAFHELLVMIGDEMTVFPIAQLDMAWALNTDTVEYFPAMPGLGYAAMSAHLAVPADQ
jgi:peptide/nickel transport system substrate-binding protein